MPRLIYVIDEVDLNVYTTCLVVIQNISDICKDTNSSKNLFKFHQSGIMKECRLFSAGFFFQTPLANIPFTEKNKGHFQTIIITQNTRLLGHPTRRPR